MAASVWIMFCSVSVCVPSPPAVTERPSAETMPWVTVGVPAARPSAFPMATTESPTTAFWELPKVTVGRLDALLILSSATSLVESYPTSVVGRGLVWPYSVTVMAPVLPFWTYSSITWLFVTTSPSDVMIIPVPWSSLPPDFTSIDTTAGMTLSTSCGMVTLPLRTAAPGVALPSWMTDVELLPLPFWSAIAVTPAPIAPPIRAATRATGSQARSLPGEPRFAPAAADAGPG